MDEEERILRLRVLDYMTKIEERQRKNEAKALARWQASWQTKLANWQERATMKETTLTFTGEDLTILDNALSMSYSEGGAFDDVVAYKILAAMKQLKIESESATESFAEHVAKQKLKEKNHD